MYCRKCGKEVEGDREFCENCAPQTPSVDMKICQYCGKETSKAERFCQHCGGYFKDSTAPQKKWQPPKPQNSSTNNSTKGCRSCGAVIPKANFYCPKCGKMADTAPYATEVNSGSFAIGFILVWCVGLIGLIIAYSMNQSETWRGAKCCFKILIALIVVLLVLIVFVTCLGVKFDGYNIYY